MFDKLWNSSKVFYALKLCFFTVAFLTTYKYIVDFYPLVFCLKSLPFQLDLMHVHLCIFSLQIYLIHNQLLNKGGVKKWNRKESPVQMQFLLAV